MRYQYGRSNPNLRPRVRTVTFVDPAGRVTEHDIALDDQGEPARMSQPVRCRCGEVYDLGTVEVTARYADCSVWTTPCCHRKVDDRPAWGSAPDAFTRIPGGAW